MKRHTILFATDFSGRDHAAFQSACQLALGWDARLFILHVQEPRFEALAKSKRKDPAIEFRKYVPEDVAIEFDHVQKSGDPDKVILKFVEEHQVDMIILGTHGRAGIDRVFSGSVAESIMRKSDCPVMTLRGSVASEATDKTAPRILVPIDFSVHGYAALDFATKIALEIHAEITIVYVDNDDSKTQGPDWNEHQKQLWDQLKKFKPQNRQVKISHKLFKGDPAKEICQYANVEHYDYVILGTHGRSGIGRALLGSVAESVVRCSNCPVITVKPSNKRTSVLTH